MSAPGVLAVSGEQFDRIEAAWAICAYGNSRRAVGQWSSAFRECVAEVLGYEPPEVFALARVEPQS